MNARGLETESGTRGCPAGGCHDKVGFDTRTILEGAPEVGAPAPYGLDAGLEAKGDAFGGNLFGDEAADAGIETTQEQFSPVRQGHLGAKTREDPGEFDRNVASPDDDDTIRELVEVERFVGSDGVFVAGKRRNNRPTAPSRPECCAPSCRHCQRTRCEAPAERLDR